MHKYYINPGVHVDYSVLWIMDGQLGTCAFLAATPDSHQYKHTHIFHDNTMHIVPTTDFELIPLPTTNFERQVMQI